MLIKFVTTDSTGVLFKRSCLRGLTCVTLRSVRKFFFENDWIRKEGSSIRPFWLANVKFIWFWSTVMSHTHYTISMLGNKISNFKTFASIDSLTTFSQMGLSYGSKVALLFSVEIFFFLKKMELGKNATNELYSCSKWPFWQANMKIDLILVYWDARNSLFYKLVIPFKDGVTFAVTTATQSLQRCS